MADSSQGDYEYVPQPDRPAVEAKTRADRTAPEGTATQFGVEYDEVESYRPYLGPREPPTANLRPVFAELRQGFSSKKKTEKQLVDYVQQRTAEYGRGRKPVLYKRTVIYGPWIKVRGQGK
jgi:hypothetical protein